MIFKKEIFFLFVQSTGHIIEEFVGRGKPRNREGVALFIFNEYPCCCQGRSQIRNYKQGLIFSPAVTLIRIGTIYRDEDYAVYCPKLYITLPTVLFLTKFR